jgi:hypothetical protein
MNILEKNKENEKIITSEEGEDRKVSEMDVVNSSNSSSGDSSSSDSSSSDSDDDSSSSDSESDEEETNCGEGSSEQQRLIMERVAALQQKFVIYTEKQTQDKIKDVCSEFSDLSEKHSSLAIQMCGGDELHDDEYFGEK